MHSRLSVAADRNFPETSDAPEEMLHVSEPIGRLPSYLISRRQLPTATEDSASFSMSNSRAKPCVESVRRTLYIQASITEAVGQWSAKGQPSPRRSSDRKTVRTLDSWFLPLP